tara:strand:- start:378227 stop:378883 length:657 start_codon:yes stop_codon:yes gene_type:complete
MWKGQQISLSVLSDRTDPSITLPQAEDILGLMGLDTEPNTGVDFNFKVIGNVDYSPTQSLQLKTHSLWDNDFQRTSNVQGFLTSVDTLLIRENQKDYKFNSSSILRPLLEQLKAVKGSNATQKAVVLYSDLQEISDVMNVVDARQKKLLMESPLLVAEKIKTKVMVPELNGVYLYIIHYPTTRKDNRDFRAMLEVYRHLFEGAGLQIEIGLHHKKIGV